MSNEAIDEKVRDEALKSVRENPVSFRYLPFQDDKIAATAVKLMPENMRYVQDQKPKYRKPAREWDSMAAEIPLPDEEKRQIEADLERVIKEPLDLKDVKNKTPEICMAAVERNGYALEFVPEDKKTHELCLSAVNGFIGYALKYVPESMKTENICRIAVENVGDALEYVPEDKKTYELCLTAVRGNGPALQYVPESMKTEEIRRIAVENFGGALQYISEDQRTPEICNMAVANHGMALAYVPNDLKTPEICLAAIRQNANALPFIPQDMRTDEIFKIADKQVKSRVTDETKSILKKYKQSLKQSVKKPSMSM